MKDCWVIAAITILATEAPHYIKKMFVTNEIQEDGKYVVRIYNNGAEKLIQLDDYFPCFTRTVSLSPRKSFIR